MRSWQILHGDCRDALALCVADESVDSIVTDPPYELGFMGKKWDGTAAAFDVEVWRVALNALKPGGHLLAFGGTRTYHRITCAIEDAGFEIRDCIMWLYGSGFPKFRNLKPAYEPITVARKPLRGTVAKNLQQFGVGALNVDACRIEVTRSIEQRGATDLRPGGGRIAIGRWPANVIHDGSDEVVELFPAQAGAIAPVHRRGADKFRNTFGVFSGDIDEEGSTFRGDTGSAARFFYCAKASRKDRNEGLDGFEKKALNWSAGTQSPGTFQSQGTERNVVNYHPTVKPTALMRYLCRLVTPMGGNRA